MKELRERAFEILDEWEESGADLTNITPWDIFVKIFSEHEDVYILVLKSDLPILEKIASGLSVHSISNTLGCGSKNVMDAADLWGLEPMRETLDFSPLVIYYDGMTSESLMTHINDILPTPIDIKTADIIIYNIKRYYDLKKFVEEEEMP